MASFLSHSGSKQTMAVGVQSLSSTINGPKERRTVMLIGETGCGKSTLINCMASYFLGGTVDRPRIVIPNKVYRRTTESGYAAHSEANIDDPTVSQTRKCAMYEFEKDNVIYRFIDTPGLSDFAITGGRYGDDEVVNAILTAAGQAGELQAIILIINGSVPKLTVNLGSALRRIAASYPDVLLKNMIAVFSNSYFRIPNFDISLLPNKPKFHFTMNNAAFSSRPSDWDAEEAKMQIMYWEKGFRRIDEMIRVIDQLPAQQTQTCSEIVVNRSKIQDSVYQVVMEIDKQQRLLLQMQELRQKLGILQQKQKHIHMDATRSARDQTYLEAQDRLVAEANEAATREDSGQLRSYVRELKDAVYAASPEFTTEDIDQIIRLAQRWKEYRSRIESRGSRLSWPQQGREGRDKKTKNTPISSAEQKLTEIRDEMSEIEAQLATMEEQQREASERISKGQAMVDRVCQELKATCRDFNFTAELAKAREELREVLQHLQTAEGRRKVEDYLDSLRQLGDNLNQQSTITGKRTGIYSKKLFS